MRNRKKQHPSAPIRNFGKPWLVREDITFAVILNSSARHFNVPAEHLVGSINKIRYSRSAGMPGAKAEYRQYQANADEICQPAIAAN